MKSWHLITIGLLLGIILSGIFLLIILSPRGHPLTLAPKPTESFILAHISGDVISPGVYELVPESRAIDLINAAGGFTDEANREAVNQAGKIHDGAYIHVPSITDESFYEFNHNETYADSTDLNININTAVQMDLESLPGIGPAKAEDIITYREENGWFLSIEDIMNVPGIGPSLFNDIKDMIIID